VNNIQTFFLFVTNLQVTVSSDTTYSYCVLFKLQQWMEILLLFFVLLHKITNKRSSSGKEGTPV